MNMFLNSSLPQAAPYQTDAVVYETVESLLEDVTAQMAPPNHTSRPSRGSGPRTGGSIRVVKPNSINSSPRASMTLNRRRTIMGDGPCKRRPFIGGPTLSAGDTYAGRPLPTQSRPVSWHPSSYVPQHVPALLDYSEPRVEVNNGFGAYGLPPTPAVHSDYASPASTFSPLSQPFIDYDQPYPYTDESSFFPPHAQYQPSTLSQQTDSHDYSQSMVGPSMYTQVDWNSFVLNGFNCDTSPPTPDNLLPVQHPDRSFQTEDTIPYHSLEDPESSGEELVGMGLYDTPEKVPPPDPILDNYCALMMQQLRGMDYKRSEPTGKGLKLEEAWVPTASDDGEDDGEAEEDDDVEGSSAADDTIDTFPCVTAVSNDSVACSDHHITGAENVFPSVAQGHVYGLDYCQNGWL
ncbi:MAG: hypothetical protein M1818_003465 [Claussenomyces sp. TS43310]|nr:MAG: hypothetical protein M1818_003465 [Claussenomyces sp. TS43310]